MLSKVRFSPTIIIACLMGLAVFVFCACSDGANIPPKANWTTAVLTTAMRQYCMHSDTTSFNVMHSPSCGTTNERINCGRAHCTLRFTRMLRSCELPVTQVGYKTCAHGVSKLVKGEIYCETSSLTTRKLSSLARPKEVV